MRYMVASILAAEVLLVCACGGDSIGGNNNADPTCGNGELDTGESCDGANLGGQTCSGLGYLSGVLACATDCTLEVSACEVPEDCDNGVLDPGEDCDGENLGGQSCDALGMGGGTLACTPACRYDPSGCDNPPVCGNGDVEFGETCDDGNTDSCDGCSGTCLPDGCGNGEVDCGEQCDDGNTTSGDGCSADCMSDESCGNGVTDLGEVCDDGNTVGGDGCSAGCLSDETCGNGIVDTDAGETCDDGNAIACDGCSLTCRLEACGNNIQECMEQCDDGNTANGDGCTADCNNEVCLDGDTDGHVGYDAQVCPGGDDNCDADPLNWTASGCTTCTDADGDGGFGTNCDLSEDCDDNAPGIVGLCQANGCPQGWIEIPAGAFEMGCNSGETCWVGRNEEAPRHTVTLSTYCIEETEVSVGAYRACDVASVCTGTPDDTAFNTMLNWTQVPAGRENHPMNGINRGEAQQYCQLWLGGELPTEAQWEKAARGTDQRKYPWGDTPEVDCNHCNYRLFLPPQVGCGGVTVGPATWEVGSLTSGAGDSPYGLKDMAGNVMEHVLDTWSTTFYGNCPGGCVDPVNTGAGNTIIRGGGIWNGSVTFMRTAFRWVHTAGERNSDVGFRCARAP